VSGAETGAAAAARARTTAELAGIVSECRLCPRLVAWREQAAANPPARFAGERYWARPVPGWGDPEARIALVGLAPAANGGNRTGRMFTGDRSGDFLYAALHRAGFANQAESTSRDDGLAVRDVYITAVARCAPPDNKPLPEERDACLPYLARELELLGRLRVIVALGGYAWDGTARAVAAMAAAAGAGSGGETGTKVKFGHLAETSLGRFALIGSYHPSQQNTFTGRLTPDMLDRVLLRAREMADAAEPGPTTPV
jgi:uracil-DNA glycosylase